MGVTTTKTNKPFNPRGNDQSPKGYNRASLFSGKALDFDGVNDYIQADGVNETLDNYTLSWNLKTTSTQNYSNIFSNSTNLIDIYIMSNGQLRFYTDQGYNSTNLPPVNDGQWKNLVLSISGTSLNIYVNGVLSETLSITDVSRSIANIRLGYIFSNLYAFNGEMAGFKLFNTALTAEQVADLYNNPEKVVPTGVDNTALKLWLPMMEGAGTTAYDGSGNGNHGTISGATYVNGIGAPVAQSAVMDWNKLYDFDGNDLASNGSYVSTSGTKTYKVHFNSHDVTRADQQIFQFWNNTDALGMSGTINFLGTNSGVLGIRGYGSSVSFDNTSWSGLTDNTFYELEFTIDWDAESITSATLNGVASDGTQSSRLDTTNTGLYLGARVGTFHLVGIINYFEVVGEDKWTNASGFKSQSGSYDMTISGSPTQILAPQGLTTGRDITGVNLFENVRKQGALNLDGNSWAEVHDNASLDMTTTATMEAWVNCDDLVAAYQIIMVKSSDTYWTGNYGRYTLRANQNSVNWWFDDYTANSKTHSISLSGYNHLVVTKDGTEEKLYINGALVSTQTGAATFTASPYSLVIGAQSSYAENWDNQLAQPRIYNRALTAEEVQRNYNAGKNTYTN